MWCSAVRSTGRVGGVSIAGIVIIVLDIIILVIVIHIDPAGTVPIMIGLRIGIGIMWPCGPNRGPEHLT